MKNRINVDASAAIEGAFGQFAIMPAIELEDDGFIGIGVTIRMYHDAKVNPSVKTGPNGTPVIIYVINTNTKRTGTDSDEDIIRSMLSRGYVVATYDFHNHPLATTPALEDSLQLLRTDILNGTYTKGLGGAFPRGGGYHHHYIVPAGYNIQLGDVFWRIDKHGADGTMDKLVHVWNSDLRSCKGERFVKWVHEGGERKKTVVAKDGSEPRWFNAFGQADEDGEFTKLKYTWAEGITDLVNPDGSPIDLGQHMNIIYPTNPTSPVPMMVAAGSAGHIAQNSMVVGRPHQQIFTFNGYALAVYDHLNVPMTREDSHGYFDGKLSVGGATRDPISYSVDIYNDKKTNTAAIRYIRYLASLKPTDADYRFKLDIDRDAIGVMGVSKSGTMGFLGEAILQSPLCDKERFSTLDEYEDALDAVINSFTNMRVFSSHHGETRYENGIRDTYTKDGITIYGGERQPWLTYNGEEIPSGAKLIYCACGNNPEDIHEGHAPVVISRCLLPGGDGYATQYFDNICRTMGVPALSLEYHLGHTMMYGKDSNFDADGIRAFLDLSNYYLRTSRQGGGGFADGENNYPVHRNGDGGRAGKRFCHGCGRTRSSRLVGGGLRRNAMALYAEKAAVRRYGIHGSSSRELLGRQRRGDGRGVRGALYYRDSDGERGKAYRLLHLCYPAPSHRGNERLPSPIPSLRRGCGEHGANL